MAVSEREAPGSIDVRAHGAVGDGAADDTRSMQAALDAARGDGSTVRVAPGRYRVNALTIPPGVSVEGTYTFNSLEQGSWLFCVDGDRPALTMGSGTALKSLGIHYPEQGWDSAGDRPRRAYPPMVHVQEHARRLLLRDILFTNAYDAIDADRHHEYLVLQNVQGYAINRGIVADFSSDIDRWTTVHLNMNCSLITGDPEVPRLAQWTREHGTAFTIRRADWPVLFDCFCWGYRTGLLLEQSPAGHGSPGGVHIVCCGFDACGVCVDMRAGWGVRISDTFFVSLNPFHEGEATDAAAVIVSGGGEVSLKNCRWWGCEHGAAVIGCSNSLIEGNSFTDFGRDGSGHAALALGRGVHQVANNHFWGMRTHNPDGRAPAPVSGALGVEVQQGFGGAVLAGNYFRDLDGGSIRIDADASNVALHANLHQSSTPAVTARAGHVDQSTDKVIGA